MIISFVASEVAPFSKTGGLADVIGALPKVLCQIQNNLQIIVFSPYYQMVRNYEMQKIGQVLSVNLGNENKQIHLYTKSDADKEANNQLKFIFIGCDDFFDRPFLYGDEKGDYPDNAQRFILFSKSVLVALHSLQIKPDIVHCHDWQSSLIPLLLKRTVHAQQFPSTKSVFTIHNLGYQGIFSAEVFTLLDVPDDVFSPQGIEYYGKVNFLKAGIVYSDFITTVSPTYGEEIQKPEKGFGLDGVLRERRDKLLGILNGIDYEVWDPRSDKMINPNFDITNLTRKTEIKQKLYTELNLKNPSAPLAGVITRLAQQKGIDLIISTIEPMINLGVNIIILGKGDKQYEKNLLELKTKFPDHLSVILAFDEQLAHRIYAGSDFFLIPSQYEPCGLTQMIALRYGAIPIAFKTGGLKDTIRDISENPENGNGFLFSEYNIKAFLDKINQALTLFRNKRKWYKIVRQGMQEDFSWTKSAKEYLNLYQKLIS
ncbi:MAG: glycogen synthase GlgA [candidate division WOR-3 bacterium]|nr:glycogen synthase GlgA [candidate division WOR-3 bacterium]